MNLLKRALLLGLILGTFSIVLIYLVVEFLPPVGGLVMPIAMIGTAVAFQWRTWFEGDSSAGALKRLGRGLALTAASVPVGAVTTFLIVWMWSGYPLWADNVHRTSLTARGLPPAEIESTIAQDHKEARDYWKDGIRSTLMPGTLATLATSAVGAVVLRRRSLRP